MIGIHPRMTENKTTVADGGLVLRILFQFLNLFYHFFDGLAERLLLLVVEGSEVLVVIGCHRVDIGLYAAEAVYRGAVVCRGIEDDIHHLGGFFVAGILGLQSDI